MDMQYHTPPTSTVEPTVKANRRMWTRRRLIPYLFFPLVPAFGEHFFVLMPTDLLLSFLDHASHLFLRNLSPSAGNQSTMTLVCVRRTPGRP